MQRALVTGASRGIGRALVLELRQVVFPLNGVHAASKHALEAISEALAAEAGPYGIRVLVVQLGAVDTGMYERQERYLSPASAHVDRAQSEAGTGTRPRGASAEQAARAIVDAVTAPDVSRLRVPIGQDAAWILAERASLDDAAWIRRLQAFGRPSR
jgi:NAD(P)-dependent dehydrogenase (short-subunit alcohol dehydrogenase family)